MILKTFGCSHVFGAGLLDPIVSAWPVLLSKKLDLPIKNYGIRGSSNEQIVHEAITNSLSSPIIAANSRPISSSPKVEKFLIVILTTHPARVYWPVLDENYLFSVSLPFSSLRPQGCVTYRSWLKYHFNLESTIKYQRFLFQSCKELLEFRGHTVYIFNWQKVIVENNLETMHDVCEYLPKDSRGHFLEEAQKVWADYVYKIIK